MPRIQVAKAFKRHVECPDLAVDGTTVRAALDQYFAIYPTVRGYVLDERGAVRKHVVIFVGDDQIADRSQQSDAVTDGDVVYIFQALSGG